MQASDFVHLHVHSEFSMLDGLGKVPKLVAKAKVLGQTSLALTDHGGMYGAIQFFNECKKQEIKPIVGVEAYYAKSSRHDKQLKVGSDQFHLTLLAMNHHGYQNLMKLVSVANFEGFSYKPRIDWELLTQLHEDIIVTSGCMNSIFNQLLLQGNEDEAVIELTRFRELLGDRFYMEVQAHPAIAELTELTKKQIELARKLSIELVATNDVHYIEPSEAEGQDALLCVQTRKLIADSKRMSMINSPDFYLRSSQEMAELFHGLPEALTNTKVIAERCNLTIPTGQLIFPKFQLPKGETNESLFEKMSRTALEKKFPNPSQDLLKRLEYEMAVIINKGYAAYFLITQDFVNWAKNNGVAVGPGRGSAAGSLVSYVLNITTVDPILHGLAFERFLNPQRPTPPDIDIDFADSSREKVIDYVADKYGADHVGHVITFGRMEARVAIRDIGRVLGMPYEEPDKIAKLIPNDPGHKTSLENAVTSVPELIEYYKQPKYKKLIDLAKQVEGSVRHSSVHAAALIITDKPITNYAPVQKDSKTGKTITQYDMYALDSNISDDAIGLLKFDFLGLRNLTIIELALSLIKTHKGVSIDVDNLVLDDAKTFALLSSGETMGVFQLESPGMRRVARSLKPSQFSDITAMVALFRPGPMDLIPQFIEGKHNPKSIQYPDPTLKPILKETYGVMVYQEQILQIANVMAGYSLGEADILRRAIGKKKKKLLDENKKRFVDQSVEKGYSEVVANKVWGFIEAFANYGFNKAHATSYAMIAYQTAYLKANFPVEYMTALMAVESGSTSINRDTKVAVSIEICKQMGIKVLAPDINMSVRDFSIESDQTSLEQMAVRFGLNAIKHVGSAAIETILETRQRVGTFTSLTQFIHETDSRKVNKTTLECLIKVGAFDQFGTRASMLKHLESIRSRAASLKSATEGQDSLFEGVHMSTNQLEDIFPTEQEYPKQELLSFEKEFLGLYLTDHPMARALKSVEAKATKHISDIDAEIHKDQVFSFGGVITSLRTVTTKKSGKPMAFGQIEDSTGSVQFVCFPRIYEEFGHLLKPDAVLLMKAKVDFREEEVQLIAEKILVPTDLSAAPSASNADHELFIPRNTSQETLQAVGKLLKANPGSDSVVVVIPNGGKPQRMVLPYSVNWTPIIEQQIEELLTKR